MSFIDPKEIRITLNTLENALCLLLVIQMGIYKCYNSQQGGKEKSFMLCLHHTDSIREWAYDRASHIGKLDKGLDEAIEKGWTIIDMEKDWKVIYPFEL